MAVETLKVGDEVLTTSGATRKVTWLASRTLLCRGWPEAHPVRVKAGAFADHQPSSDLWLSEGHSVCVRAPEEALVPIGRLVNGVSIERMPVEQVTYWHVELEEHDILFANNLPAESYINVGNAAFFGDGATGKPRGPFTLDDYCRPFLSDEAVIAEVRARLQQRAQDQLDGAAMKMCGASRIRR